MKATQYLIGLAALGMSLPALAHDFTTGALTINHPYIVATPPTAKSAAGYLSITNAGAEPDTLTGIESDPAGAIHETTTDANGVARMGEVEALEIPAGETVTLRPRAQHVMFTGLSGPLLIGAKVEATLVFEKAGSVPVTFDVQSRADSTTPHPVSDSEATAPDDTEPGAMESGRMDHGTMDGGTMDDDTMDGGTMDETPESEPESDTSN